MLERDIEKEEVVGDAHGELYRLDNVWFDLNVCLQSGAISEDDFSSISEGLFKEADKIISACSQRIIERNVATFVPLAKSVIDFMRAYNALSDELRREFITELGIGDSIAERN